MEPPIKPELISLSETFENKPNKYMIIGKITGKVGVSSEYVIFRAIHPENSVKSLIECNSPKLT
jgi:hypothetical protein